MLLNYYLLWVVRQHLEVDRNIDRVGRINQVQHTYLVLYIP